MDENQHQHPTDQILYYLLLITISDTVFMVQSYEQQTLLIQSNSANTDATQPIQM